jgi:hypothetical protein
MAPVKTYSELQRQLISNELGRRGNVIRKAAEAPWHSTSYDVADVPSLVDVLTGGR